MCLSLQNNLFWSISLVFPSGKLDLNSMHSGNSTELALPFSVPVTLAPDLLLKKRLNCTASKKDQCKDMVFTSKNF